MPAPPEERIEHKLMPNSRMNTPNNPGASQDNFFDVKQLPARYTQMGKVAIKEVAKSSGTTHKRLQMIKKPALV